MSLFRFSALLAISLLIFVPQASAQCPSTDIQGIVYRDFDLDGTRDTGDSGVSSILVTAYDSGGSAVASTSTGATGTYSMTLSSTDEVRLEFTGLPNYLKPGFVGSGSNSTVLFTSPGNCNADMGLSSPAEYCDSSPSMIATCSVAGDPLQVGGQSSTTPTVVHFPHRFAGILTPGTNELAQALGRDVGSVWGVAYHRTSEIVFVAASLRRHAGFGPEGPGGIYAINVSDPNNPSIAFQYSLSDFGYSVGTDPRITDPLPTTTYHPTLNPDVNALDADTAAWGLAAKMSLGDIDLSSDDQTLYVVNVTDNYVYVVNVGLAPAEPSASNISRIQIPDPGCANGEFSPWGLKVHDDEVYLGVVCTAETSQSTGDLVGHVMKLGGGTFSSILSIPLNYDRQVLGVSLTYTPTQQADWNPWQSDVTAMIPTPPSSAFPAAYPQPMLADIEFDGEGNMALGFRDRFSIQGTQFQLFPEPYDSRAITFNASGGDVLRAFKLANGTFQLESNAAGPTQGPTAGAGTNEGPGGGEFYYQDFFRFTTSSAPEHYEIASGALALVAGSQEIAAAGYDVIDAGSVETGGVKYFSDITGAAVTATQLYDSNVNIGTYGKGSGMGDIELICAQPPIQIGNRVWIDTNSNGCQDPGENGVPGVTVRLYNSSNTLVATTTTNSNGEWLFSNLSASTQYRVALDNASDFNTGGALADYRLTKRNAGKGTFPDINDSDASVVSGFPSISLTTSTLGDNNHTYDFGFTSNKCSNESLESPANSSWNTYLGTTNIVGIINTCSSAQTVTLRGYNAAGVEIASISRSLSAMEEQDIVLNAANGFPSDAYGRLALSFSTPDCIRAFNTTYRFPDGLVGGSPAVDFSYVLPFSTCASGQKYVPWNTFNPGGGNGAVIGYAQINNSSNAADLFTVETLDSSGNVLNTQYVSVAANGRGDVGIYPSANQVGTLRISAGQASTEFCAHYVRYGTDTVFGQQPNNYNFAVALTAEEASTECEWVNVSRALDSNNWLTVMNTGGSSGTYTVTFTQHDTGTVGTANLTLQAGAMSALWMDNYLASGMSGVAKICPSSGASFAAVSEHYFHNSVSGSVCSAYGTHSRFGACSVQYAGYNTFLGQSSWVRMGSTCPEVIDVFIRPYDPTGSNQLGNVPLWVKADMGADIDLFWTDFSVGANNYGKLELLHHASTPGPALSEVLRLRVSSECNGLDIAASYPLY